MKAPSETSSLIVDLTKRFLDSTRMNARTFRSCSTTAIRRGCLTRSSIRWRSCTKTKKTCAARSFFATASGVKLRELYEKIIESSDADVDSFVTSEATKDFMARLRIGIMADQAPVRDPKDGPPHRHCFPAGCYCPPRRC